MKFYLGQDVVDHHGRKFVITDLFSSQREWVVLHSSFTLELENGCIHMQGGNMNMMEIRKIGFVEVKTNVINVISVEQAERWYKKGYLNFG